MPDDSVRRQLRSFDNLRKYKMMLNPKKYVFGVSSRKLLSYMISPRGIDVNPNKLEVIKQLQPPQTREEIQKLAGMMTALKSTMKSCPS
jgi:hypothetical protein